MKIFFSISSLFIVVTVFLMGATTSSADSNWQEVTVRAGFEGERRGEDFNQWEVAGAYRLPWHWTLDSQWKINTRINTSLGILHGADKNAAIFTLGPGLLLSKPDSNFSLDTGISPTLISRHKFKHVNFGTAFQFTSHITMRYQFSKKMNANIRFQHMSNAGINNDNPGLDQAMLGLGYQF